MNEPLNKTFKVLTKTKNEAAVAALMPALDSALAPVAEGAAKAVLDRRSPVGMKEIIRRLHTIDDTWKEIIEERRGRMASPLRDALLGGDEQTCANACQAILWFREFDLMPALVNATEDEANPFRDMAAKTLLDLGRLLYDELSAPRDYQQRRDPQLVRKHVVTTLERSVNRLGQHRRGEIVEAFLTLVGPENVTLNRILRDPHDPAYLTVVDVLTNSNRGGVMRLVLRYMDDRDAPSSIVNVISHRTDPKFIGHLLKKIGAEPSAAAKTNLKRMKSIAWVGTGGAILEQLDDAAQHAAVQMVLASGVKRDEAFELIQHQLRYGKEVGRRAAAEALAEFRGADANDVALRALRDDDPIVQATIVAQLRTRGVQGALAILIESIDSPHEVVRQAARESLEEFSFSRFLAAFDMLEDMARRSTGALVKKIDPTTVPTLRAELE